MKLDVKGFSSHLCEGSLACDTGGGGGGVQGKGVRYGLYLGVNRDSGATHETRNVIARRDRVQRDRGS